MKKIDSFEAALQKTGRPVVDFSNIPEDYRSYFENQYKAVVITEAINNGWVADWSNPDQKKWIPIFSASPSGFVFDSSDCRYSDAYAGDASRLCFKTEASADYAGKTFTGIFKGVIVK